MSLNTTVPANITENNYSVPSFPSDAGLNTSVPAVVGDNYAVPSLPIESLSGKEDKSNKGIANGYAPLDATSKVPSGNLPTIDVSGQISTHNSATTSVHGIANTANLIRSEIINVDKTIRLRETEFNTITELNGALINIDGGASYASVGSTEVIVENIANGKAVGISTDRIRLYTYSAGGGGANISLQGTASGTDKTITLPNATGTIALTSQAIAFAIALG